LLLLDWLSSALLLEDELPLLSLSESDEFFFFFCFFFKLSVFGLSKNIQVKLISFPSQNYEHNFFL
jgi:hypothetical protein